MKQQARDSKHDELPQEVALSGVLADFRQALRDEIDAARKAAQSSAVQLIHGELIGRAAGSYQYLFKLENAQLSVPDDFPGDLSIPGRDRVDATVISVAGTSLTLSVVEDLGAHVGRASLSSNMTNLLKALITRIEEIASSGKPNLAGDRMLAVMPPSGEPMKLDDPGALNEEQCQAVESGLGRDLTFIEGPPGTGKTKTIGALGERLARAGRSVLLVSHTNTAVDQALLHIADALGEEAAESGAILRVGQPKDERVVARENLLVKTHVERRSAELVARQDELTEERSQTGLRLAEIQELLDLMDWARLAEDSVRRTSKLLAEADELNVAVPVIAAEVAAEKVRVAEWSDLRDDALAAERIVVAIQELRDASDRDFAGIGAAHDKMAAEEKIARAQARDRVDAASAKARDEVGWAKCAVDEAEALLRSHALVRDRARNLALLKKRAAELPSSGYGQQRVAECRAAFEEQREVVAGTNRRVTEARKLLAACESAGGMARRLRRLPTAEQQIALLAAAEDDLTRATGRQTALQQQWEQAEAQLAETERVEEDIREAGSLPSVDTIESVLRDDASAAEAARRALVAAEAQGAAVATKAEDDAAAFVAAVLAQELRAVDEAKSRHAYTAGLLESREQDFTAFVDRHSGTPAEVLERALVHLGPVDELLANEAELCERHRTVLGSLSELVDAQRSQVERFCHHQIPDVVGADEIARALVAEAERLLDHAGKEDPDPLRSEQHAMRQRVPVIDEELGRITEQLDVVEAAVIENATVVATTLTRAYLRDQIKARSFDTVILDEASMAPIPALWAAAALADSNLVVVGDPQQLPPIAQAADENDADAPASKWLARDVFEVAGISPTSPPDHLVPLRTQYRMHPAISEAPNILVYAGRLRNGANTTDDSGLDGWYHREWGHDAPLLRVDTSASDAWCSTIFSGGRSSRLNFLSATIAVDLAGNLLREDRSLPKPGEARILIATPFKPQAKLLTLLLRHRGLEGEVVAGTVHSFQGSEAAVVIYDLVLDEPHRQAGLFTPAYDEGNRRQFNVGLTRARHRMFVIGDFPFLQRQSKKAFLGRLLTQLEGAPLVSAESVIPTGLAARSAESQRMAMGHAEPVEADRLAVTQQDFDQHFLRDLASANERVVIYSPFLTENRLAVVEPQLRAAAERGVRVYVVTKPLDERKKAEQAAYRRVAAALTTFGVIVVPKKAMHEKLVFIDDGVVWIGSLNPMSFRDTREIMMRHASAKISAELRSTMQLDIAFSAYENGESECPICGADMALAEGPKGPYRRCVIAGCYSRGLADAPLTDGKMTCHSCGGDLYFGSWGEKSHWRCRGNDKHRMKVHANHLKLPAMQAMISKRELAKLLRDLGVADMPVATAPTSLF